MQLNDQKAGMEGLDKETINKIIYDASNGTPYFTFQEKRQKSIDSRVNALLLKIQKITEEKRKESLEKVDALCASLETERDLSHSIVHIDMDAFYAAVETLDNPDLKDKPMAVGSLSMLSTSNYHARKYGVRAAMPGYIAKKLCPNLVIVPTHFERYQAISHVIRKIVEPYDPDYRAASLDEVYLDLTEFIKAEHRKGVHDEKCSKNSNDVFLDDSSFTEDCSCAYFSCMNCASPMSVEERDKMASEIVQEIRLKIFEETSLTASAGIAPNTMLAKVCSDKNKPNGQYQIPSTVEAVKSFISSLHVKKISGIGPVQGQILQAIGITTCKDMWSMRGLVFNLFSENSVDFYMRVALGIGSTCVKSDYERKSIGNERTFREISKPEDLHKKCQELCLLLVDDLNSHKLLGKLVVLKIKTANFKTFTRNNGLPFYTDDLDVIAKAARKLLDAEIAAAAPQPLKLRLMGVRMCNVIPVESNASKKQVTLKSFLQHKTVPSLSEVRLEEQCAQTSSSCPFDTHLKLFHDHGGDSVNDQEQIEEDSSTVPCDETGSEIPEKIEYFCPVCCLIQNVSSLIELNHHIDSCLNKKAIKKILASDFQNAEKRKFEEFQSDNLRNNQVAKKVRRIDDYFKQGS